MSEEGGFGCSSSDIKSLSLSLFPVYQRVPRHKQAALHQLRRQHAVGAAVKGHEPLDVLHVLSLGWNLQCVAKPDGYNFYQKSQRLAILEFFRAMDSSEDWEEKKDAEKGNRYAPVFGILQLDQLLTGETGLDHDPLQLHTVGVRGSISMWIVLSLSLSCPRSRRWASHRGSISRTSVRWLRNAPSWLFS